MYRWYQASHVCYVYLSDVPATDEPSAPRSRFRQSRWFTRGWTLQELIAPDTVLFFSETWESLGDASAYAGLIEQIAGIPSDLFADKSLTRFSIAQRMSWAAPRTTTRKEDTAYCLLGLFDVNLPLLYGEGDKAFQRLQEEIIKQSSDQTIFAWGFGEPGGSAKERTSVLAPSPSHFCGCREVIPCDMWKPREVPEYEMTKMGVHIEFPVGKIEGRSVALLNCRLTSQFAPVIGLPIDTERLKQGRMKVWRLPGHQPLLCSSKGVFDSKHRICYMQTSRAPDTASKIGRELAHTIQVRPSRGISCETTWISDGMHAAKYQNGVILASTPRNYRRSAIFTCRNDSHMNPFFLKVESASVPSWKILMRMAVNFETPAREVMWGWLAIPSLGNRSSSNLELGHLKWKRKIEINGSVLTTSIQSGWRVGIDSSIISVGCPSQLEGQEQPIEWPVYNKTWFMGYAAILIPLFYELTHATRSLKFSDFASAAISMTVANVFVVLFIFKFREYMYRRRLGDERWLYISFFGPAIGLGVLWWYRINFVDPVQSYPDRIPLLNRLVHFALFVIAFEMM